MQSLSQIVEKRGLVHIFHIAASPTTPSVSSYSRHRFTSRTWQREISFLFQEHNGFENVYLVKKLTFLRSTSIPASRRTRGVLPAFRRVAERRYVVRRAQCAVAPARVAMLHLTAPLPLASASARQSSPAASPSAFSPAATSTSTPGTPSRVLSFSTTRLRAPASPPSAYQTREHNTPSHNDHSARYDTFSSRPSVFASLSFLLSHRGILFFLIIFFAMLRLFTGKEGA